MWKHLEQTENIIKYMMDYLHANFEPKTSKVKRARRDFQVGQTFFLID